MKKFTGNAVPKWINGKTTKVYNLLPEVYERFDKYHKDIIDEIVYDEVDDEAF